MLSKKERSEVALDYFPRPDLGRAMDLPTPLLREIERRRPENVRLLLRHGAIPNGVPLETQIQLARVHRRFTTRSDPHPASLGTLITIDEVDTVASQFIPITDEELKERRTTVCRFWTEPERHGIDYSSESAQLHSVVRAGASTIEIMDMLLEFNDDANGSSKSSVDASFWKESAILDTLPEEQDLSPSSLVLNSAPYRHSIRHYGNAALLAFSWLQPQCTSHDHRQSGSNAFTIRITDR
jgi:hypothetical protein